MLPGFSSKGVSCTSRGGIAPSTTLRCSSRPFTTRRVRLTTHAAAACNSNVPAEADVVVVGAGLAGLNAAAVLRKRGLKPVILEAGDDVGGRTRTDKVDGFLLDRGFQIFLTGYPEARQTLDFEALQLQPFYAGARVWYNGQFHTVADPLRHFVDGLMSLSNPIGSVGDKVNVGLFRLKALLGPLDAIFDKPETTIVERLRVRKPV
eukprot:GHRQ01034105.1.p1 GENE.GHRQ01034105.1~~GHRQ01034105.1.p1  ORF type:complete len:206 (+),score=38.72 GHRQ01034105.1:308-925(+)